MNVYGIPEGWKPPTWKQSHPTTYLEWEIPKKLEKKLNALIKKEIRDFRKVCKCDRCK